MGERIYNFSAGPAVLPEPVIKEAQKALWSLGDSGIGILEHSHRGPEFTAIIAEAEATCREIASIPDSHAVLFLHGGASTQFFMAPMSFLGEGRTADYIDTGIWSKKAIREAERLGSVHVAASGADQDYTRIPAPASIRWSGQGADRPAYAHFTSNNTIYGTQWRSEPVPPEGTPLLCDASSDIFSRPIDIGKYGLLYAGAQKNLGPAGVALVIVDRALVETGATAIPTMLQYRTHVAGGSRFNTPPAFGVYMIGEVLKWLQRRGGLEAMEEHNRAKAQLIYDFLDQSELFRATAHPDSRSTMNICFRAPSAELEAEFVAEAARQGLAGLKGHRAAGGLRASIYNAFPGQGCERLVEAMKAFERANKGRL